MSRLVTVLTVAVLGLVSLTVAGFIFAPAMGFCVLGGSLLGVATMIFFATED